MLAVEKENKKMYEAGIIVPVRFSDWVSNLVAVRKKTGEIRLCIDFRNLNRASLKYPTRQHLNLVNRDLLLFDLCRLIHVFNQDDPR